MCPPDEMDPQELQAREEMTGQWPGQFLLDELQLAEMRAIIWAHLEGGTTQAAVAREIGMSPHKLGDFLRGVVLHHGEIWDKVVNWCEGRPRPRVSAELVALGVLAAWSPNLHVRKVRADIASAVLRAYDRRRIRLPLDVRDALAVQ